MKEVLSRTRNDSSAAAKCLDHAIVSWKFLAETFQQVDDSILTDTYGDSIPGTQRKKMLGPLIGR